MDVRHPQPTTTAAALGLAALLLAAGAAGAKTALPPKPKSKATAGRIEALAMDGSRVAYDVAAGTGPKARCNAVFVWNVATGRTVRVSGDQTCRADSTSTGAGVSDLGVTGTRAAWVVNQGGNSESDDYLYTSALSKPKERRLASAFRSGDAGGILAGSWIGGLVGAGRFLAVNRWVTDAKGAVSSARLQTIGVGLRTIATGTETMTACSTDGNRVAVLRDDGSIGIYSTAGRLLRAVTPATPTQVALRGDDLAALTTGDRLEVYNSHSGKLLHRWRVAHGARSLDVSSGLAAYAAPAAGGGDSRVVHVLRLATGRDRVLATTTPQLAAVQLEAAGLVYAVNPHGPRQNGYLVFTPMSRLPG